MQPAIKHITQAQPKVPVDGADAPCYTVNSQAKDNAPVGLIYQPGLRSRLTPTKRIVACRNQPFIPFHHAPNAAYSPLAVARPATAASAWITSPWTSISPAPRAWL